MILRRPTLAAFKHVYTFIQSDKTSTPVRLWPSVRKELLVVIALSPLLFCDLRAKIWAKVIATDASGVVMTPLTAQLQTTLWPVMSHKDCYLLPVSPRVNGEMTTWPALIAHQPILHHRLTTLDVTQVQDRSTDIIQSSQWKTVISSPWRRQWHINELEFESVLLGVRWTLSHPNSTNKQLLLLIDSSTVYFGINKGRSSSPRVLSILRRYSAHLLAGGLAVLPAWVPSALNPADDASRKYCVSHHTETMLRSSYG
jgi:hypothetical protein